MMLVLERVKNDARVSVRTLITGLVVHRSCTLVNSAVLHEKPRPPSQIDKYN